ncbi:probable leucine-rich repeat receptor-like protein kinase At1g35710 [Quercus robur]|uniref:probable leucine-rich repeat receptor-like protein kinase At1g35710 n=1 Tax=Quercus robur TaxID=38942 RepID=UPI002162957D|nr:probable leucine-rich repeat receptor-like protein kinase At1g35710 [Quercus robur]
MKSHKVDYAAVDYKPLTGFLPQNLCQSGSLQNFFADDNHLIGPIPKTLKTCMSLITVHLEQNQLFGNLSEDFGVYRNLQYMDLSYNRFSGEISHSWSRCPQLGILLIACDGIGGGIPPEIGNFTQLHVLDISYNRLVGKLPKEKVFSISTFDGKAMYKEIIEATRGFDDMFCIGRGKHGTVYKPTLTSGNTVAVKKLQSLCDGEIVQQKEFFNEIKALTEIHHRNIVKLHGFCSQSQHSILIYEYFERGSLATILSSDGGAKELDWNKRMNIIKGLAHALSYMHRDCSPPIVHRDISSKNVLLDSDYEAHVSDFGTAKLLNQDSSNWTSFAGTHGYVAHMDSGGQGESSGGQEVVSGAADAAGGSEGSTGSGGGEGNNEGMVGGGLGQGNGDDGHDDRGRRGGGDVEDGRRPRNSRGARMAEIFIMVIAQTAAAAIGIDFLGLSSRGRGLLIFALGTNLFGFMCCVAAIWQNDMNPHAAEIWANIGSVAGALGFILMLAMVLPPYLLWMIIMACIGLLVIVVFSFMS